MQPPQGSGEEQQARILAAFLEELAGIEISLPQSPQHVAEDLIGNGLLELADQLHGHIHGRLVRAHAGVEQVVYQRPHFLGFQEEVAQQVALGVGLGGIENPLFERPHPVCGLPVLGAGFQRLQKEIVEIPHGASMDHGHFVLQSQGRHGLAIGAQGKLYGTFKGEMSGQPQGQVPTAVFHSKAIALEQGLADIFRMKLERFFQRQGDFAGLSGLTRIEHQVEDQVFEVVHREGLAHFFHFLGLLTRRHCCHASSSARRILPTAREAFPTGLPPPR